MNVTSLDPEPIRCYHTNSGSCTHQDDDGCSNFTVPSVTRSKIGAVLHLAFRLESGDVHYVDIDINLPSITASNSDHYDGSTHCSGSEVLTWNLVQSSGTPILVLHSIGKQDMLVAKCAKSGFWRKCNFNILHLKSQDF